MIWLTHMRCGHPCPIDPLTIVHLGHVAGRGTLVVVQSDDDLDPIRQQFVREKPADVLRLAMRDAATRNQSPRLIAAE